MQQVLSNLDKTSHLIDNEDGDANTEGCISQIELERLQNIRVMDRFDWFVSERSYSTGMYFGQLPFHQVENSKEDMTNKMHVRQHTIRAKNYCALAVLDINSYHKFCVKGYSPVDHSLWRKTDQMNELFNTKEILRQCHQFSHLSVESIGKLCDSSQYSTFYQN